MADVINDYPKTAVVVQGHTDTTGSEQCGALAEAVGLSGTAFAILSLIGPGCPGVQVRVLEPGDLKGDLIC